MKKIKVIVKDKTILELAEPANAGDIIDLTEITQVDTAYIEKVIDSGKDKVYLAKLESVKKEQAASSQIEINKLNEKINSLEKEYKINLKLKEEEINNFYQNKIKDLENEKATLITNNQNDIKTIKIENELEKNKINEIANTKYIELENKYNNLVQNFNQQIDIKRLEVENKYNTIISNLEKEKQKEIEQIKEQLNTTIKEKEDTINSLQRSKIMMNVKQTGEDLESWCHNEVTAYMQNGMFNCTWEKDNKVIKTIDDTKGSKADYLFKIYASNNHLENEELASICLEMKDENPDSVNKKKNADYYKKLEENKIKKNCKYAILVSNLEIDKPNDLPIYKVREYENMYVVRPAYLMVFLNMITSLTTRFSELILANEQETLLLKSKTDLIEEFNKIKDTYLDKPLNRLSDIVEEIIKQSSAIKEASRKIDDNCDKIKRTYILEITEKINKFDLKLEKTIFKKIN